MNEDQPPPGAEPQRRGSSRNSISLTNAPGDLQATWGPTQTHMLLAQNHSSPSSFSPRLRLLLSQPCSLLELSEGSGPHRHPKPPQLAVVRWVGRGWWAQSFSCYCSRAGLTRAPPHRLKAGGTPCSVSAVLHGLGHDSHTGLPSRNCSVPQSSIQRKGHPVLGTEEAVNVHGGSRPPHVSFRDSDLPALFLRALASLRSHSAQPGT